MIFTGLNVLRAQMMAKYGLDEMEWCGPCQMMAPVIGQLAGEYEGRVKIGKLNVDENPDIAVRYKVMSIPTMIIFRNGEVFSKEVGASSKKEVEKAIGRAL